MEIQVSRQMAVSPARVVRALTEPVEVTHWAGAELICDEATYRLTGPTLMTGALGGRLLERTATSLRFEWVIAGETTEVEIQIKELPQAGNPPRAYSEISVHHGGIPAGIFKQWDRESWRSTWVLLLRFLRSWVERAERPALFRYDGPFPRIEQEILLEAPLERAWRALVEPDLRRRWLNEPLGPVLAQEEGRLIAFGWPEVEGSRVTFYLEPLGPERTRLSLRHEGLPYDGIVYNLGWYDYLFACYQETAEPMIGLAVWLPASPGRLWPLISTQAGLRQWFNEQLEIDPVPGGRVWFPSPDSGLYGEVVAVHPERQISFTWSEERVEWPAPTLLTMELIPEAGGTLLRINHAGFGPLPEQEYASYRRGWSDDSWALEAIRPLISD